MTKLSFTFEITTQIRSDIEMTVNFSAPEPNAQVYYCDHTLSVVRPSVVRRSLFTFLTSPLNPLNGNQLNLTGSKISMFSTKFVFFGPIEKKMAALASDWLRHFRLLL